MNPVPIKPLISTSDLDKIDVRVGTILAVEDVAHSEKLVRLRVDFGDHAAWKHRCSLVVFATRRRSLHLGTWSR